MAEDPRLVMVADYLGTSLAESKHLADKLYELPMLSEARPHRAAPCLLSEDFN